MGTFKFNWACPDFYSDYVRDGKYPEVEVLYKYRDWKDPYHRKLLEVPVIYLASPSSFEDPLDCHVPEDFPTKEELPALFMSLSYVFLPPNTCSSIRKEWAYNWSIMTPLANPVKLAKEAESFYHQFCAIFGVLSLTANPSNGEMWSKYGANHKGFCVGYRKDILEEFVGGAGPVIYTDDLPHVVYFKDNKLTQHVKNVFFKEKKWSFEQEYRCHKIWDHVASADERNISIPEEAICEIIVGRDIDEHDYNEIKTLAEHKYPHALFRKE